MVTVSVHCPRCHSDEIYRHRLSPTKRERFRCQFCHPLFQLTYRYTPFNIGMITSNNWGSYAREVPKQKHLTGKIFTQRIERNNLRLPTRIKRLARKTICFSRSVEIHEKVIGAFIEKYMFY